jgi:uncharacterized membrane protein
LTRRGSHPIAIRTFKVPAVAHGANTEWTVDFTIPSTPNGVGGYSVEIQLDSAHQLDEYDEADNRASVPLP